VVDENVDDTFVLVVTPTVGLNADTIIDIDDVTSLELLPAIIIVVVVDLVTQQKTKNGKTINVSDNDNLREEKNWIIHIHTPVVFL
jgi:hypothetical protein